MTLDGTETYDLSRLGRRVVLATHRRSGTHLTIDFLRAHFAECRAHKRLFEGLDTLYLNLETLNPPWSLAPELATQRLARAARPIVKTHAGPEFQDYGPSERAYAEAVLCNADVIAVHRDVRDVLASFHHYHRAISRGSQHNLSTFIQEKDGGVSRPRAWANRVREWREAGAHSIAYEEIIGDPAATLRRFAELLELTPEFITPTLPSPLRGRWHARGLAAFSRSPEATTVPGAPGRPLDWRESLTQSDRDFIHQEAGDLLIELGYEDSDSWVAEGPSSASPGQ